MVPNVCALRPLNQQIHPQKFPCPVIEDLLDRLHGKSVYTKLDLRDGFHQIRIHPDDTKYFAFATPSGQYEYVRMPFGYSEASAEFQKRLLFVLRDLLRRGVVLLYIDDILIPTDSVEDNLAILREVLVALKKYGLQLNLSKCLFLKEKIEFLGYEVSRQGITMSQRHVQAVLDFPQPKNLKQVQVTLG